MHQTSTLLECRGCSWINLGFHLPVSRILWIHVARKVKPCHIHKPCNRQNIELQSLDNLEPLVYLVPSVVPWHGGGYVYNFALFAAVCHSHMKCKSIGLINAMISVDYRIDESEYQQCALGACYFFHFHWGGIPLIPVSHMTDKVICLRWTR